MKQPISRPAQKWAATMGLVALAAVFIVIVTVALIYMLPTSEFTAILSLVAVLAIALSFLIGKVVRWLSQD